MNLKTAVLIMMPPEVQAIALPLIRRWAPRILKYYPAHLTVLFPFVEYPRLADGVSRLRRVCAEIEPFVITLSGYKSFPNVAYMAPHPEEDIQAVLKHIYAAFPEAPPYGGMHGDEVHPHVTVGLFESEIEQQSAILPDYPPLTFCVDCFHVLYGTHDVDAAFPWITQAIIPLGNELIS